MVSHTLLGKVGEKYAIDYLSRQGYHIQAKNFYCAWGELDIVAAYQGELVFVEVKSCRDDGQLYCFPEESVQALKRQRIMKSATFFIAKNRLFDCDFRFDIIAVQLDSSYKLIDLQHFQNAFED